MTAIMPTSLRTRFAWFLSCTCLLLVSTCPVSAQQEATPDASAQSTEAATAEPMAAAGDLHLNDEDAAFSGPGRYTLSLDTPDGRTRTALADVPSAAFGAGARLPLVFVLHGATSTGRIIARRTGFDGLAEAEGFVAVYPDGLNGVWNDARVGDPRISDVDDVAFLRLLAERMAELLPLNGQRFAAGYSMGGMMGLYLACASAGEIGAVVSIASTMPAYLLDECEGSAPVSVLFINGSEDRVIPYGGSRGYLSAEDSAAWWAAQNACRTVGEPYTLPNPDENDGVTAARLDVTDCAPDSTGEPARVSLVALLGGGHVWPGRPFAAMLDLGAASMDFDATTLAWSFFAGQL